MRFCKRAWHGIGQDCGAGAQAGKGVEEDPGVGAQAGKGVEEDLGVERKLAQHDNAHTPSSKKAIGQKVKSQHGSRSKTATAKATRQNRAEGRRDTRSHVQARPTRFERHAPDKCPRCGMSDLTVTKTSKRNVTEIPPPQKAVTTHSMS